MADQIGVLRPESRPSIVEGLGGRWYIGGRVPGHELDSLRATEQGLMHHQMQKLER